MFGIRTIAEKLPEKKRLACALAVVAALGVLYLTANRWWPLSPAEKLFVGQWKGPKADSSVHTFLADRRYLEDGDLAGYWSVSADGLLRLRYRGSGRRTLFPPRFHSTFEYLFKFRFDDSFSHVEMDCVTDQSQSVLTRVPPE